MLKRFDWVTALAWRCGGVRGCAVSSSLGALTSSMRHGVVYLSAELFGKFGIGQSPLAGIRTPRPTVNEPVSRPASEPGASLFGFLSSFNSFQCDTQASPPD